MSKQDLQSSSGKGAHGSRPPRFLIDSVSSDEGPETESLLHSQLPMLLPAANRRPRRESLTAPPSPTDSRKSKLHLRQHNYMNHLHHLIHWRDIWSGEPHKGNEVLTQVNVL
ncbi:Ankyrin repeat-rich membrane spanning protein [Operophtera brumata]|uniref:Ankyrin repeat-rich membrane spanning protein n=1 Tax=Operophtera brumata TaxID=104452 RepID=A0A0L7L090_OPEBR|nr:Ankyrin repeat-rich membrane spanning protein [Operophtera brumata]